MTEPLRLEGRIPETGFAHPDDALSAFLAWVADSGITLYAHQEEAILEVFAGNHVILDAPTGSGKSLVAIALHFKTFAELGRTWYTAPIKALVSEKFFALCAIFGAEHVGMMTGDAVVNRDAPILCCTAEILANLALREGIDAKVDSVVMDEFHYYADRDRGMAWQIPLLTLPKTTFLLMSATLGDTRVIREDLVKRTGRAVADVRGVKRPVPLEYEYSMRPLQEAIQRIAQEGKVPAYVVHFAQNDATEQAQALMSIDWCSKEEKRAILDAVKGFRFASPFGSTMRRLVLHGIGLHHAGLLPRYRMLVERLAQQGLLKLICGTDTLGVGINVPIRTVMFTQLCKFDGEKTIILRVRDFKQISGRAGRAGYDSRGYVIAQAPEHVIENARVDAKITDPKKRRKIVRAQPPAKGYKHWDEDTFKGLVDRPAEALESRFTVDHGRLLSMMQSAEGRTGDARDGVQAMLTLIDESHASPAERDALRAGTATLLHSLDLAGVVKADHADDAVSDGGPLHLDSTLQHDFSLNHSLSLFLVDALGTLDPAVPTHALDVLTWVESIIEQPRQVLLKQTDRARFLKMQELKAAGMLFEERIAALEGISWPKPNAEAIYLFFNAYKEHHPWVDGEGIRPKSVAREMVELQCSFSDYVKDLSLQRSEGVLLRYLTDVYKALNQNVPAELHTQAILDILAYLRAMLALVDSSLVTEWEAMRNGADAVAAPVVIDISADKKTFNARVRAELHALVRSFARQEWEDAAECVRQPADSPWTAEHLQATLLPFIDEVGGVRFDHTARLGTLTTIKAVGPHLWEVRQVILPVDAEQTADTWGFETEDDADEQVNEDARAWAIVGRIDLSGNTNPEGPLVELVAIGA